MSTEHEPAVRFHVNTVAGGEDVGWITIDNPRRLNSLDSSLLAQLQAAAEAAAERSTLRAVLVTGAGEKAFIGGADVHELNSLTDASAGAFISRVHSACQALRSIPVPVLAVIRGYCLGAGLEVAASCDIRIATDDATFGMPEVRLGVPSVVEAALLPRTIGWGKTAYLLLTGLTLSAGEALRWGLVERVSSPQLLDEAVNEVVIAIVQGGREAIKLQKRLMRDWEEMPLSDAIEAGIDAFVASFRSPEPARLTRAFLDRKRD